MIKFRCQRCSQKIAVNDEGIGAVITCPTCVESMIVPPRTDREFMPRSAEAIPLKSTPDVPAVAPVKDARRPHLAQLPVNKLLQTLLRHRRELLQTQEIATDRLAALEQRLVLVQMRFQRRLGHYQERIAGSRSREPRVGVPSQPHVRGYASVEGFLRRQTRQST